MNHFIRQIHIDNLFHLKDLDISISSSNCPHLIITGKNGSGKTLLLDSMSHFFQLCIKESKRIGFAKPLPESIIDEDMDSFAVRSELLYPSGKSSLNLSWPFMNGKMAAIFYEFSNAINSIKNDAFVLAFYQADRSFRMIEPDSPQKPVVVTDDIRHNSSGQFINFLVDLKFQELLAISNKDVQREAEINSWFDTFVGLLRRLFEDESLTLQFSQQDSYSFKVCTKGQTFGFNEMSDGFKAALNIVADLILRMHKGGKLSDVFNQEGIVLIDEIETHLHLSLQKMIMPFLTGVFPNIQFIVTTHSPFVLSSMPNAVAYDLEHQEVISDLTEYSYEALAEGYFGVKTSSSYTEMRLNDFRLLLEKGQWSEADKIKIKNLNEDFKKIPELVSPLIVGEYRRLAIQYADKLMTLQK